MRRNSENIYKRKDGRWEGRYAKGRKENGSLHYGYIYGKTRSEIFSRLTEIKKQVKPIMAVKDRQTIHDWFTQWLETDVKKRVKASTYASYFYKMKNYIFPYIGELSIGDVTEEHLQILIKHLTEEKALSTMTIRIVFVLIKGGVEAAIEAGILTNDVSKNIPLPKKNGKKVRSLTRKQQKSLENSACSDLWGMPILLALNTGLRIGELVALRWKDIDLDEKIIHVQKTYQRVANPTTGKTSLILGDAKTDSSERLIPFSDQVKKMLNDWRKMSGRCKNTFVFEKRGKPVEPRLVTYHFKRIASKAGCQECTFHQLRHTFATRCLEANGDVVSVSAMLGHTSAKTTLDTYVDSLLEQRRVIIEAIGQL